MKGFQSSATRNDKSEGFFLSNSPIFDWVTLVFREKKRESLANEL